MSALPNIVLVHGAWADGSSRSAVIERPQAQFAKRMGASISEVPTNHVAMVSHPDDVLNVVRTAATAVAA